MCECVEDGIKVENGKLYSYDDERWYVIQNAKFCPFCGNKLQDEWSLEKNNLLQI